MQIVGVGPVLAHRETGAHLHLCRHLFILLLVIVHRFLVLYETTMVR